MINTRTILLFTLIVSLVLDSTLISLPLVAAICILMYLLYPDIATLVIIFLAGLVIDSLRLAPLGATSLFLVVSCASIYLYENTFELKDLTFAVILLFIFTNIYGLLFGYGVNIVMNLILFALAGGLVYYFGRKQHPSFS